MQTVLWERKAIKAGERILLKTRNSLWRWDRSDFQQDYVGISADGAQFLAETGVALVGVDYLLVGVFHGDGHDTHRILLSKGVWILEGLELSEVQEGNYDLFCLPLRIPDCDGSPARVVLRRHVLPDQSEGELQDSRSARGDSSELGWINVLDQRLHRTGRRRGDRSSKR